MTIRGVSIAFIFMVLTAQVALFAIPTIKAADAPKELSAVVWVKCGALVGAVVTYNDGKIVAFDKAHPGAFKDPNQKDLLAYLQKIPNVVYDVGCEATAL